MIAECFLCLWYHNNRKSVRNLNKYILHPLKSVAGLGFQIGVQKKFEILFVYATIGASLPMTIGFSNGTILHKVEIANARLEEA